jgi:nitrite reductase (NADH) large subunit
MRPGVVIVGAGPAGARCAELVGDVAAVTLIGAEPELPYNRVALSKLLAGDLEEAELVTHDAARLDGLGIAYRGGSRVLAIDRAERCVHLADGGIVAYDALVLATGALAFRLPLPGADLPGVVMYRTLAEVRAMMATAREGGEAVVIGGGLLGLEAAAGLARRGMRVTVVHAVDRLMERQLDAGAATMLARRLASQGIDLVLSASTTAIEGDDAVAAVLLSDGRHGGDGCRHSPRRGLGASGGTDRGAWHRGGRRDAHQRSRGPGDWRVRAA